MGNPAGSSLVVEDAGRRRALKSFGALALSSAGAHALGGCAVQGTLERDAHPQPRMAYLAGLYVLERGDAPVIVEIQYEHVETARSYTFPFRPTRYVQVQEVVPGSYRMGSWMIEINPEKRIERPGPLPRVFQAAAGVVHFLGEYSLVVSSRRDAAGIYYGGRIDVERVDLRFHDREMMKGLFPNFAALPFVQAYAGP